MISLVLDCNDPAALEDFYTEALRYQRVFAENQYIVMQPLEEAKPGPTFILQKVAEPRAGKNRMHFDIHTNDVETEVERLVKLGATRLSAEPIREVGVHWIVLADPEGNELCICKSPELG